MKPCDGKPVLGQVHSLGSFATHDGPGIRFLVFLQGCLGRCLYCQNPDTWDMKAGTKMSTEDILVKVKRCLPYINSSGGGLTVSGGEPLLQIEFLMQLFKLCKKQNIHTAVDTSAFFDQGKKNQIRGLIRLVDLFIVDIKAGSEKLHKKITSRCLDEVLEFLGILESEKARYWLRYVLVPGLNDSLKDIRALDDILAAYKGYEKFEFLPYHTLGRHKWEHMKLKYFLTDNVPASRRHIQKAVRSLRAPVAWAP